MPTWLWRSIVATSMAIVLVAGVQWASCRFYVLPTVWPWYAKWVGTAQGKSIDPSPTVGCNDADARTIAVMMSVLTTLISLSRKAE